MSAFICNSSGEESFGEKLRKCKCTEVTHNIIINGLACKTRFVIERTLHKIGLKL